MEITAYTVELVNDPFGIISGTRYEFLLDLEVDEEDELYSQNGLYLRVIYSVDGEQTRIVKYELYEQTTKQYLDYDLEPDELEKVEAFCKAHYAEAEHE